MNEAIIYTLPSKQQVLDQLNADNKETLADEGRTLTFEHIEFSEPEAIEGKDGTETNTNMIVKAIKGAGYKGECEVSYRRLDLSLLFLNIVPKVDNRTATKTTDLLADLNTVYGFNFEKEDIVEEEITVNEDGTPVTITIKTEPTSYAYIGELTVIVGELDATGEDLELVLLVKELNGLNYIQNDTNKGQAGIYSYSLYAEMIKDWILSLAPMSEEQPLELTYTNAESDDTLAVQLNKLVPENWVVNHDEDFDYNLADAQGIYHGPTSEWKGSNQNFASVLVVRLANRCLNFAGNLYFHYNP